MVCEEQGAEPVHTGGTGLGLGRRWACWTASTRERCACRCAL